MSEIQAGESYTRAGLPDEITLRIIRRADAEQNRHVNIGRIADALEKSVDLSDVNFYLRRIADALDRAFPIPPVPAAEELPSDEPARNEAGLPIPPWVTE
jgi:hypothetical protein